MNRYLVWEESESREDALEIEEMSHWSAARRWAERYDECERDIANGSIAMVTARDIEDGLEIRFRITGGFSAFYRADEVLDATPSP